jgi:hypothetical protein
MSIGEKVFPILVCSIEELLRTYIEERLPTEPTLFGLENFSIDKLIAYSFNKEGDDSFSLYEKDYRLVGSNTYANFKVYYHGHQIWSNGFEFWKSGRITTVLKNLSQIFRNQNPIKKIQILMDDKSFESGALMINNNLLIGFAKTCNRSKAQFKISAIATDYGFTDRCIEKTIATNYAKSVSIELLFKDGLKKSKKNPSLTKLIKCLVDNFPDAANELV